MVNLVKLHLKYLYNKTTYIILTVICLFVIVYLLTVGEIFTQYSYRWLYQTYIYSNYQNSSFFIFKLVLPILSIYLFGSSFLKEHDDYSLIIVKSRAQRIKYFLSKNVSIYIFLSILFIFIYILYKLIGVIQIPNFINYDKSSILYLKVFLLSIYYGNMSLLIILIVNQSIAYVSNMIIYVIVEILSDASNNIIKLVNFIFPIIDKSNKLVLRYDLVIIIFILIFFINNIIYYMKDL